MKKASLTNHLCLDGLARLGIWLARGNPKNEEQEQGQGDNGTPHRTQLLPKGQHSPQKGNQDWKGSSATVKRVSDHTTTQLTGIPPRRTQRCINRGGTK